MGRLPEGEWALGVMAKQQKELDMAYKITDECTACGSCIECCPSEAIKEGDPKYAIDGDLCVDCGSCVDECPNSAIKEG